MVRECQPIRIESSFGNTVCWKSTNQNSAISKSELLINVKNFNHFLKNIYQKTFEFPRVTLQKREKIPIDYLFDVVDVDSCFFIIFWTFLYYKISYPAKYRFL